MVRRTCVCVSLCGWSRVWRNAGLAPAWWPRDVSLYTAYTHPHTAQTAGQAKAAKDAAKGSHLKTQLLFELVSLGLWASVIGSGGRFTSSHLLCHSCVNTRRPRVRTDNWWRPVNAKANIETKLCAGLQRVEHFTAGSERCTCTRLVGCCTISYHPDVSMREIQVQGEAGQTQNPVN